jgi:hypothetical protein
VNDFAIATIDVRYDVLELVKDNNFMSQPSKDSEIDEAIWNAWLAKNKAQDRFRYERRLRIIALTAVFIVVSALLWRFVG